MHEDVDGGTRIWVPILDSAERVGVLGAVVPDATLETLRRWTMLSGLVGEMVVTKTRYGDALSIARRTRAVSLAAELRWNLLPPLTFTSPDVVVAGMLEPAYEIAGDTFDYAINGDRAHIGLFDAMGHGLEACRMANLAVGSYQHSRRTGADLRRGPPRASTSASSACARSCARCSERTSDRPRSSAA